MIDKPESVNLKEEVNGGKRELPEFNLSGKSKGIAIHEMHTVVNY